MSQNETTQDAADQPTDVPVGDAPDAAADTSTQGPAADADAGAASDVAGQNPAEADLSDSTEDAESEQEPDWEKLAEEDPRSRAELLAELTEAESRRDEYLEDVRRARAEFENYRKRTMREATAQRDAGKADVAGRLLDVLDDFDRTLDAAEGSSDDSLAKGVSLVHGKFVGTLTELGLARIDQPGETFDPNRHEAVQQIPADEPIDEPVVEQVLRPGYEMAGRVIRAAMVVVKQ